MNRIIEDIYKKGNVEDAEGNIVSVFPASILYEEGKILYNIIQREKSRNTIETGMAYGVSTLFILQALRDNGIGNHIAIDPCEESTWKSIGLLNIKRSNLDDIFRFYNAPSHDTLPKLLSNRERFDFAFIDGAHMFDYALIDFFYIDKLLDTGGYIVFHDLWMPSIRKVLSFILRDRNYEMTSEFSESFSRTYKL